MLHVGLRVLHAPGRHETRHGLRSKNRAGDGFHNLKVNFYFIGLGLIGMIMLNYLVLTLGTLLGD